MLINNKPTTQAHYSLNVSRQRLIQLIVLSMAIYLIIAGFAGLRLSITAMRTASLRLMFAAAICVAGTYICAACTYYYLSAKPIRLLPTLLIQICGGLVNRLLPAGLGGLGINALYLKRQGHTLPAATAIVASNNILGFVGNGILAVATIILHPHVFTHVHVPQFSPIILFVVVMLIAVVLILSKRNRKTTVKVTAAIKEIVKYFRIMSRRPLAMLLALLSSIVLTSLHATALYLVLDSVGIHMAWALALFAVSTGSLTGAAIPTPGGIGGAEAGIAAALLSFHVSSSSAVAAALLYRLLTYWIPMAPGYIALRIAGKRYLY